MSKQNSSKPVKTFRAGGCQASVWRNESEQDGQTVVRHSIRIQKNYRTEDGQWKTSDYLFPDECPKMELVLRKAFEFISLREDKTEEESAS